MISNKTDEQRVDRLYEIITNMGIKSSDDIGIDKAYENALYRMEWEEFIYNYNPKIIWTLTFIDPRLKKSFSDPVDKEKSLFNSMVLSDNKAISIAEELIKRVSQRLYGRSKIKQLEGFGSIEYQKCGQPHFHFLITSDVDMNDFTKAVDKVGLPQL